MGAHGPRPLVTAAQEAKTIGAVSLKTYLPSLPQVSRETIAVLAATLIAAFVIAKVPALSRLVRDGSIPSPLN